MAYTITEQCTGCGECLPLCPVQAIAFGEPVYRIDAQVCVECLGYSDEPQCEAACPADAITEALFTGGALRASSDSTPVTPHAPYLGGALGLPLV